MCKYRRTQQSQQSTKKFILNSHRWSFQVPSSTGSPLQYNAFYVQACSFWTLVRAKRSFPLSQAEPNRSLQLLLTGSVRKTNNVTQIQHYRQSAFMKMYVFWPLWQSSCVSWDPGEWHSLNAGRPVMESEHFEMKETWVWRHYVIEKLIFKSQTDVVLIKKYSLFHICYKLCF